MALTTKFSYEPEAGVAKVEFVLDEILLITWLYDDAAKLVKIDPVTPPGVEIDVSVYEAGMGNVSILHELVRRNFNFPESPMDHEVLKVKVVGTSKVIMILKVHDYVSGGLATILDHTWRASTGLITIEPRPYVKLAPTALTALLRANGLFLSNVRSVGG